MTEGKQSSHPNLDEIDLKAFFSQLWEGKLYIVAAAAICFFLASVYVNNAERKHQVVYTLAPVTKSDDTPNLRGFSGLASLAGVPLPSNSSGDFLTFRFLLISEEVAELLLQDKDLMQSIFEREWNIEERKFLAPDKNFVDLFLHRIKNLFTGNEPVIYAAPDGPRLANWMRKNLEITEVKGTGLLELRSETTNPKLLAHLMTMLLKVTDDLMKKRYIVKSEKLTRFYNEQLSKARSREHREALATLLAQEDQKLILALRGDHFVAEPITVPAISLYPTSPNTSLILALSFMLGGFLGSMFVLARKALIE